MTTAQKTIDANPWPDRKERPILFSTEMVQAILDHRKCQTRRVVKPQPDRPIFRAASGKWMHGDRDGVNPKYGTWNCPYGHTGDRLYVRETFAVDSGMSKILYRADADEDGNVPYLTGGDRAGVGSISVDRWKPSIHMPKKYARIWLQVFNVRVERLQDISVGGMIAEGLRTTHRGHAAVSHLLEQMQELWDSINADRGFPWDSNPWVWAVEFTDLTFKGKP